MVEYKMKLSWTWFLPDLFPLPDPLVTDPLDPQSCGTSPMERPGTKIFGINTQK